MTAQTKQEELIEALKDAEYRSEVTGRMEYLNLSPNALELIAFAMCSEVLSALKILKTANNHYADGEVFLFNNEENVPLSAIEEMENRYKL